MAMLNIQRVDSVTKYLGFLHGFTMIDPQLNHANGGLFRWENQRIHGGFSSLLIPRGSCRNPGGDRKFSPSGTCHTQRSMFFRRGDCPVQEKVA